VEEKVKGEGEWQEREGKSEEKRRFLSASSVSLTRSSLARSLARWSSSLRRGKFSHKVREMDKD